MLHFANLDTGDQNDNLSYKRNSDPSLSDRSTFEKLEALKRDFLPKSLALHISLAKNKSLDSLPANAANHAGLGLGAMMLSATNKQKQQTSPAEVVINVGSADALNASGSAVSETDRYLSIHFDGCLKKSCGDLDHRLAARMRACGTRGKNSPADHSRGVKSNAPGTKDTGYTQWDGESLHTSVNPPMDQKPPSCKKSRLNVRIRKVRSREREE
jgi:hypothetical protein